MTSKLSNKLLNYHLIKSLYMYKHYLGPPAFGDGGQGNGADPLAILGD